MPWGTALADDILLVYFSHQEELKILHFFRENKKKTKEPFEFEKLTDILEDFKMVLVVRNDLKLGKGKIATQCRSQTPASKNKRCSRWLHGKLMLEIGMRQAYIYSSGLTQMCKIYLENLASMIGYNGISIL